MTIAPPDLGGELFYLPPVLNAINTASARNAYGTAAQEIVCLALKLNRVKINGNFNVCFDAEKDGVNYEIKSVRTSGKIVIYDWRLRKEQEADPNLKYLILVHKLKQARNDILQLMAHSPLTILILPAFTIHQIALTLPLNKHKNYQGLRNGYSRTGYKEGYYNLPLKPIVESLTNLSYRPNPLGGPDITIKS